MTPKTQQRNNPTTQQLDNDVALSVRNVSKKFCKNLRRSMTYGILDLGRNLVGIRPDSTGLRRDEFWALRDINFELRRGEALGLIGANGSGKSTLLRMIAGIFPPDKGEIAVRGRVGALIALGAGFHPHMTGRENIYLNGTILGMSRAELEEKSEAIIDFAEIRDFIDAPVATYSSGMRVRLGFAVAIHIEPEVLLVDEILAVGDLRFRVKCFDWVNEFVAAGRALIFVSHNVHNLLRVCKYAVVMNRGAMSSTMPITDALAEYEAQVPRALEEKEKPDWEGARVLGIVSRGEDGQSCARSGGSVRVHVRIRCERDLRDPVVVVYFEPSGGTPIASFTNRAHGQEVILRKGMNEVIVNIPKLPFLPAYYYIHAAIYDQGGRQLCQRALRAGALRVQGTQPNILEEYFFAKMPRALWQCRRVS